MVLHNTLLVVPYKKRKKVAVKRKEGMVNEINIVASKIKRRQMVLHNIQLAVTSTNDSKKLRLQVKRTLNEIYIIVSKK